MIMELDRDVAGLETERVTPFFHPLKSGLAQIEARLLTEAKGRCSRIARPHAALSVHEQAADLRGLGDVRLPARNIADSCLVPGLDRGRAGDDGALFAADPQPAIGRGDGHRPIESMVVYTPADSNERTNSVASPGSMTPASAWA